MWACRHKQKVTHTLFKTLPTNLFLRLKRWLQKRGVESWGSETTVERENSTFGVNSPHPAHDSVSACAGLDTLSLQLPLKTINDQTEQKLHSQSCDNPAPQPLQACGFDKAGWVPSGRKGDWNCMGGRARGRAKKKGTQRNLEIDQLFFSFSLH